MSVESPLKSSSPEEVVATVNRLGLKEAAKHYEIDPSNVWRFLKKHKYVSKRQYVKVATQPQPQT